MRKNLEIVDEKKTIVVGMSGGVDSSVVAVLLKEQGHHVIGLFMKNWEEKDEFGVCQSEKDYADVVKVCEKIDIPYYAVEFVKEYRENVFADFLEDYKKGHTPNPDILCNREIKFNVFFKKALSLGADYLATGHYCQNIISGSEHQLVKGRDRNKDQTYFLYTINKDILKKVIFPIGHLEKEYVRKIAAQYDLSTKNKKDSTGICFIGKRNFRKFLGHYIQVRPGPFQTLAGETVGKHTGSAFYTIGQRKGLGLGGPGEPWFVVKKDHEKNIVYVERGEQHPALFCDFLIADEISWIAGAAPSHFPLKCFAKCRYRQKDQECIVSGNADGNLKVVFKSPQRAVTIRQSIVFYLDELCLGGGMIKDHGKMGHDEQ